MSDSFWSHFKLGVVPAKPKIWVFRRFIGELWDAKIAKKSKNLQDFAKIIIFKWHRVKKVSYWRASSLLYLKCAWFIHRNRKLSVYPQLFLIALGAKNVRNFKKSEIVFRKLIFEVQYLLDNALKYISLT